MLKLFYHAPSCAAVARMALEEVGAEYDLAPVDLAAHQQHTPEYLAINPKGKIPALATPDGVLTENAAILFYLAKAYPAARLAPDSDAWSLAKMMAFNAFLAASVHVVFNHYFKPERHLGTPEAQRDMLTKSEKVLHDYFGIIESDLADGPWVLGTEFSTADIYLCFYSRLANRFDWFSSLAGVASHLDRISQRKSYLATYNASYLARESAFNKALVR